MLVGRIDLARKPSRLRKFLSDCQTGPECRESPSGCPCLNSREEHEMSPSSGSYESDAVAERRVQRVLNEKVGDRLPERSWLQRRKWYSRKLRDSSRPEVEA